MAIYTYRYIYLSSYLSISLSLSASRLRFDLDYQEFRQGKANSNAHDRREVGVCTEGSSLFVQRPQQTLSRNYQGARSHQPPGLLSRLDGSSFLQHYPPLIHHLKSSNFTTQPDITAPGVAILAAVRDSYAFMSGTSMSAPGVSGILALLKSVHPNWSPAALKSAIMTTGRLSQVSR